MKSLQESLFDKDLVQKSLPLFGDHFVPEMIFLNSEFVKVVNMLSIAKLKKDFKPYDMSGIEIRFHLSSEERMYGERIKEILSYVLTAVADVPYKEGIEKANHNEDLYRDELKKLFAPYSRGGKFGMTTGFWGNIYREWDGSVQFRLCKSDDRRLYTILIKYKDA